MKKRKILDIIDSPNDATAEEVRLSMDILDRIHDLLNRKFDGKQKLLAERLGKSEAEVSKWLSGVQNFTIRTLAKLHMAFDESIIAVCSTDGDEFMQVTSIQGKPTTIYVQSNGELESRFQEAKIEYNAKAESETEEILS